MDPSYEPGVVEVRTLFGLKMEQKRNTAVINRDLFNNIVTKHQEVIIRIRSAAGFSLGYTCALFIKESHIIILLSPALTVLMCLNTKSRLPAVFIQAVCSVLGLYHLHV